MGNCGYCKTFVIAGGIRENGQLYCNRDCHYYGQVKENARKVPEEMVETEVRAIFDGECPNCGGPGPVDLFNAHYLWSALFLSSHSTKQALSCRTCARRRQYMAVVSCATLGWWSLHGLIFTPAYVVYNLYEAFGKGSPNGPSPALRKLVSQQIAVHVMKKLEMDRKGNESICKGGVEASAERPHEEL